MSATMVLSRSRFRWVPVALAVGSVLSGCVHHKSLRRESSPSDVALAGADSSTMTEPSTMPESAPVSQPAVEEPVSGSLPDEEPASEPSYDETAVPSLEVEAEVGQGAGRGSFDDDCLLPVAGGELPPWSNDASRAWNPFSLADELDAPPEARDAEVGELTEIDELAEVDDEFEASDESDVVAESPSLAAPSLAEPRLSEGDFDDGSTGAFREDVGAEAESVSVALDQAPGEQPETASGALSEPLTEEPLDLAGPSGVEEAIAAQESFIRVELRTVAGEIVLRLHPEAAPQHVEVFRQLVNSEAWKSWRFSRVLHGKMVEFGAPALSAASSARTGAEVALPNIRGALGAARDAVVRNPTRESAVDRFYICLEERPDLDGAFSVFGSVESGWATIEKLRAGPEHLNGEIVPFEAADRLLGVRLLDDENRPTNPGGSYEGFDYR